MRTRIYTIYRNWKNAWTNKAFRMDMLMVAILLPVVMFITHYFFCYIQGCTGHTMNDWVLSRLPAIDVSFPISFLMTSAIALCLLRSINNPNMFITALFAFTLLFLARMITIGATRFMAPAGLIELKDPICNLMYGPRFITRDLFFSGHTATLFMLYLCSYKKFDKYYTLFAAITVGILLLVQHVHYTIDVVCAPLFSLACFYIAKKIMAIHHAYTRTYA